jgi:proteasome lid subunit RPN8/RPN11
MAAPCKPPKSKPDSKKSYSEGDLLMSQEEGVRVPVHIPEADWLKMVAYCKAAEPNEIIGMAHAEIVEAKSFRVWNPFILKQEVGGATCEIEQKALVKFVSGYDKINEVKCVWHSHVNMSAFFSTCDRETSNALANLGSMMQGDNSWFLSIVLNLKREYEVKIDVYKPIKISLPGEIKLVRKDIEFPGLKEEVDELVESRYASSSSPTSSPGSTFPEWEGATHYGRGRAHRHDFGRGFHTGAGDEAADLDDDSIFKTLKPGGK